MDNSVHKIVDRQREYFDAGNTLCVKTRLAYLKKLKAAIKNNEQKIYDALGDDLDKSPSESYMVEIGMVLSELSHCIKHLKHWAKPKRRITPLAQFPSKSFVLPTPRGVTLVISPWNYPFLLSMQPFVGAIAAGNTVVLKPSRASANTSAVIKDIIAGVFPTELAACVYGVDDANAQVLENKFDYIFFTGGADVGKKVYEAAAKTLTPVTLELGGKSPAIVDRSAKLDLAAKRIASGKLLNAGQTCIAPDYVIAHSSIADKLVDKLKSAFDRQCPNALGNAQFGKIISERHYARAKKLLVGNIAYGGATNDDMRKISPTIIYPATLTDDAMQEEVFAPILPVLTYTTNDELMSIIAAHHTPLALYLFTENRKTEKLVLSRIQFGGGCVNDTIMHIATSAMPFGGTGASGIGSYHGKASFDAFSHMKSILKKSTVIDMPIRYSPYTKFKDKLVKIFLK